MSKEMVDAVKQALREIEDEKMHKKIHQIISLKLSRETPFGKHGMAKCGLCEMVFETPHFFTPSTTKKGAE